MLGQRGQQGEQQEDNIIGQTKTHDKLHRIDEGCEGSVGQVEQVG